MTVIVQEDHRVPVVAMNLRYEGGEAAVLPDFRGTATLTTLLMLHRTKHVAAGDYYRLLARAGATSPGSSTYTTGVLLDVNVPSSAVALPMWLWSDQMAFFSGSIDDSELFRQRDLLREERRAALEGSPTGRLDQFAREEIFPAEHPYRYTTTPEQVERVDRAAVIAYHDRWMAPAHATLAMVGDVTARDAFSLAERYFGPIPGGGEGHLQKPRPVILPGEIRVHVAANTPHAQVSIRWATPRYLTMEDGRLDVVAELLAGGRTGYLRWKLVDERKVALRVSAAQHSADWGSQFEVFLEGAPGRTPDELIASFDTALDEIRAGMPAADAIEHAEYKFLQRAFSYERPLYRASDFAKYSVLVGEAAYTKHDFERYESITPAIVASTWNTWLPRDRRVVLLVTPSPSALPGGQRTGRTEQAAGTP